jgi:hypothetical protein
MSPIIDKLKQYPVAVIGAVVLILCVGVMFLRDGLVAELSAQEAELITHLRTINENAKNSKNLEQDVEALEGYVASINERLFSRDERSINTNFFYSFEDALDIQISDVSQLPLEDPALVKGGPNELTRYSAISYDIRVIGTFQEIIGFLYEIHRVDSLMRVADFKVGMATSKAAASGALTAMLRVVVLSEKD